MTNNCILKELDKAELEKLHTKQLINRLRAHRLSATDFDCDYCSNRNICCAVKDKNVKLLKDILKDRPHVLSKKESRQLRKEKIKKGK